MELLEREPILAELDGLLRDAASGAGRVAAVAGEAGVGKTSLVEHFTALHAARARTLRGLCDPLSTPRPLGPVHDMAQQSRGPLAAALRDAVGREGLFSAFLAELAAPPVPPIVVVEDVHWVDDATLDLLRFVGRRISRLSALLIVTYRDDEVGPDHQLHHLLGELPRSTVRWLQLPLLSEPAVQELARRSGRTAADGVHALTGGNPFFVTEVLASGAAVVPTSIRAAVLARATRLSAAARGLLDLVAVVPGRTERRLLASLLDDTPALIRECAASGVLVVSADSVGFRHELARRAWQETLEPGADAGLHERILQAQLDLDQGTHDLARIVHHAHGAGDGERVLHFAPEAAREAAALGAHRQAAAHYATALRYAGGLAPPSRAALLEAFSYERHLVGGIADAVRAREEALALRRALDDRRGEGADLRWLSRLAWFEGRRDAAVALGEQAIAVLDPVGPTPELAMAYSNLAQLCMLVDDAAGATTWGERAIALAEQLGDAETLVHALTNVGSAEMYTSQDAGVRRLERAADLALRHGFHEHAVRAYSNIACNHVRHHDHARAAASVDRTLRFAADHELETWELYIQGWRARLELQRGDWEAAERDAVAVLGRHHAQNVIRCQPLIVLALVRARRGEDGVDALVDEAMAIARPAAEPQRIGPAVAARAEVAWLRGELESARGDLGTAWEVMRRSDDQWGRAALAWWIWRAGDQAGPPDDAPEPFRLQFEGDWRGAAEAWARIGAPYQRALALAQGDVPDAWQGALAQLDALGASAAADAVRRDLRQRGARGIPRGPHQTTRRHPAGLTPGQVRVLAQLARGLSNADIARELSLSPRTVDHHVSAILAKLEVTTRAAAIAAAHERQLLRQT